MVKQIKGIRYLIKETPPKAPWTLSVTQGHNKKAVFCSHEKVLSITQPFCHLHLGHPSSRSIRMNYFLSKLPSLCSFGYNNLTVLQHRLVRFQVLWSLPLHINESWMIHIIHSIHIISTSYLTVQEKLWKTSESRVLWNTVLGPFPLELSAAVIPMWDMQ